MTPLESQLQKSIRWIKDGDQAKADAAVEKLCREMIKCGEGLIASAGNANPYASALGTLECIVLIRCCLVNMRMHMQEMEKRVDKLLADVGGMLL